MRTQPLIAFAACLCLVTHAAAQQVPADLPPDTGNRPAIDGATFPALEAAGAPVTRLAAESAVEVIDLPPTRQVDAAPGGDEAGYIEPLLNGALGSDGWAELAEGGFARALEFRSEGALALRLRMHGPLAKGVFLRVYDPASGHAFGPIRTPFLNAAGKWWTTIIFGDTIGLEFHVPPGAELPDSLPGVDAVALFYATPAVGSPETGSCILLDVACQGGWANSEALAVCMLAWVDEDDNVAGFCSGALLNRSPADGCPLVMTANHCLGSQSRANDAAYVWRFQNSTCGGTPPNPNSLARSQGSLLLKWHTGSDWNLVGLYEPPGENRFLGWDSAFWVSFADCTGIHHPSGMFKRISFGENTGALYGEFCDQDGENCFWAHTWGVAWDSGTTLPGSSGSPIMDVDRRVRGTLTGSLDACHSYYGRFAMAYDDLEPFIFNMANPTWVQRTYVGFERGTSAEPFNGVYESSFCVREGQTLAIRAGTYSDRCRIWRPMRLTASNGLVRIGQ